MTETPAWFAELLRRYQRIAIAGAPKCGKTTLAMTVRDRPVLSTDSYMHIDWGDVPPIVIDAVKDMPRFIIEGVQVARCLRKGLQVDAVIYLGRPHVPLTEGQSRMAKAVRTVYEEWLANFNRHGVVVEVPQ